MHPVFHGQKISYSQSGYDIADDLFTIFYLNSVGYSLHIITPRPTLKTRATMLS